LSLSQKPGKTKEVYMPPVMVEIPADEWTDIIIALDEYKTLRENLQTWIKEGYDGYQILDKVDKRCG
jgi:hypothetical protein